MDGANVELKFEELIRSSESFKNLNTSIGIWLLCITDNRFRSGMTKLDFNLDSFAININFFSSSQLPVEQTKLTLGPWQKLFFIFF